MKKLILLLVLVTVATSSFGKKRRSLHTFKHYDGKDYLLFGVGPNYLFGDAGGANFDNMWATEWDVLYTRPSVFIGYQHDWNDYIGNKVTLMYSLFAGNDDNSRNGDHRGYSYNSNAFEASLQTQVYFFRGKFKRKTYDVYAFFGIAGIQYNTQWDYTFIGDEAPNNNIVDIDGYPLKGRAEGIIDFHSDKSEYNEEKETWEVKGASLAIPFGVGVRFPVTNELYLGGEFGWRYAIGDDADFIDGYYTKWSSMNDSYALLSFTVTYRFAGDDDCYATYGRVKRRKR